MRRCYMMIFFMLPGLVSAQQYALTPSVFESLDVLPGTILSQDFVLTLGEDPEQLIVEDQDCPISDWISTTPLPEFATVPFTIFVNVPETDPGRYDCTKKLKVISKGEGLKANIVFIIEITVKVTDEPFQELRIENSRLDNGVLAVHLENLGNVGLMNPYAKLTLYDMQKKEIWKRHAILNGALEPFDRGTLTYELNLKPGSYWLETEILGVKDLSVIDKRSSSWNMFDLGFIYRWFTG